MLVVDAQIELPDDELHFSFSRSGGPGGQNVNKVNTKVTLHWDFRSSTSLPPGVRDRFQARYAQRINADGQVVVQSQRYRDQPRNRADCLDKLRRMILQVRTPPKRRRPTRPSKASRERRLREKHQKSEKKRMRNPKSLE